MIAHFEECAGWMKFTSLDRYWNEHGVYTLAWRFRDDVAENWTRRVNQFKAADNNAVYGAMWALSEALPALLQKNGWNPKRTGLTVALSSGDTAIDLKKPLALLGENAAKVCGLTWLPDLLSKAAHRSLHSLSSMSERDAEVDSKYTAQRITLDPPLRRILLLDDIVTRGATLREIHRAINAANPAINVVGLALAKSEGRAYAASCNRPLSNDHVPARWAELWDKRKNA